MPNVRYISNQSQIKAPGVYVIEETPASAIKGQKNRIVAFVGQCVRGPIGKAVKITSWKRFLQVFGGRDYNSNGGTIYGQVWKAMQGKSWGNFYVARACAAAAVKASFTAETAAGGAGTAVLQIDAANPGVWGNDVQWKVTAATNGDVNSFNLSIKLYGVVKLYENITINALLDNTNQVIGNDDGTLIKLTKLAGGRPVNNAPGVDGADTNGYTKLGQVVAAFTSVVGTDGALADTDYTAVGGPMEIINSIKGVNACAVAGRSNTVIKTKIAALAAKATQRVWFACPDNETIAVAAAVTERLTFTSGRLSYWFNHEYIIDPVTNETILVEPFLLPMSVVSQTDPDIHVGDFDNAQYASGSAGVYNQLGDDDRDTLSDKQAGGVSFIWQDLDQNGNQVIIAGNAVTCDFTANNRTLCGRYMKDFVLGAIGQRLQGDQFKGNTVKIRARRKAAVTGFLTQLAKTERYIQKDEKGKPQFTYTNDSSVNNVSDQQDGLQIDKLVATLIPKNEQLLLDAEIGENVTVTEAA